MKKQKDDRTFFYEIESGRVYESWEDYEKNKLPKCWMCYPDTGFYRSFAHGVGREGIVILKYKKSPSCNTIFPTLDKVSYSASLVGAGIVTGSTFFQFLPLITAVAGSAIVVPSSIYTITRKVRAIIDEHQHQQSISIMHFVDIATSLASCGSSVGRLVFRRFTSVILSHVLSFGLLSINSLGIIAILIQLVMSWKERGLCAKDLSILVSMSFFIGNIVISTNDAARIIEVIVNQPERLTRAFNMVANTTFSSVKSLIKNMPWMNQLELLTGTVTVNMLRNIGLKNTAYIIQTVRREVENIRGGCHIRGALFRIFQALFPLVSDFIYEVKTATEEIRKYFGVALEDITIIGKRIFQNSPDGLALEITDVIDQVMTNAGLQDSTSRDKLGSAIVDLVSAVAVDVDCKSDRHYVEICNQVCVQVDERYKRKHIIHQTETSDYMSDKIRSAIFTQILRNLNGLNNRKLIMKHCQKNLKCVDKVLEKTSFIFKKPLYQTLDTSMYYFESPNEFKIYNQMIYDASCELLQIDDLFENDSWEFHMHSNFMLYTIIGDNKILVFNCEKYKNKIIGVVLVGNERVNNFD